MFSRNMKISEKQLKRMIVLPVFASVMFVLPYLSAKLFGESIVPGLITFFVLSAVYVLYICRMGAWYEKCRLTSGKEGFISVLSESGLVGSVLILITFIRIVIRLAFYILLAIEILNEAQVPFMPDTKEGIVPQILVVLPLLLVALYGANTEVEKQGRIHEMIFWVLFIPFLVVILFGLKEVDYGVFLPKADLSFGRILLYSYLLLTFLLPMENYLYLRPDLKTQKKKTKHMVLSVLWVLLLCIIITLFILGIYGIHGAANDSMTTISIMRYIRLPFGVLERFDVLMIWFFMTGCFVLVCGTLYFAGHIFQKIWGGVKRIWALILVLVLAVGIVAWTREYDNALLIFICYGAVTDVPLSILLPLLGVGVDKLYSEEKSPCD